MSVDIESIKKAISESQLTKEQVGEMIKDQMPKVDTDSAIKTTREFTINEVLNHKDCGHGDCDVCAWKRKIDEDAYERGANDGFIAFQGRGEAEDAEEEDW